MPEPHSICCLHCVEDAESFIADHPYDLNSWKLISTHMSVNEFLTMKGINCLAVSALLTNEFILKAYQQADREVTAILVNLDCSFKEALSMRLGIDTINYFYPLYSYLCKYEYMSILKWHYALTLIMEQTPSVKELLLYQSIPTTFFPVHDAIHEITCELAKHFGFSLNIRKNSYKIHTGRYRSLLSKIIEGIIQPRISANRISHRAKARRGQLFSKTRKTILLLGSLYDLEFLKTDLSKSYNLFIWPTQSMPKYKELELISNNKGILNIIQETLVWLNAEAKTSPVSNTIGILIFNTLLKDFHSNGESYLLPLLYFVHMLKKLPIDLVVWGSPPIEGAQAIINQYAMMKDIPVIGMQHGGSYGTQHCQTCHFDSDFNRCTHYFTYGFDEYDITDTYGKRKPSCYLVPVGSTKEISSMNRQLKYHTGKSIDILYPLTNSVSIFREALRIKPDDLATRQYKIIQHLSEMANRLRMVIKPPIDFSDKDCAICETLKHLVGIKVVSNVSFQQFLDTFMVRAVVLDFPSTPLYESIGRDIEIFMLSDPTLPFSNASLSLLKKRVYYFENINDLLAAIICWEKGELPSRRNNEFYCRYVYRENTTELIQTTIKKLIRQ